MSEAASHLCPLHDAPLVWERGAPNAPTLHGRWYCPSCQVALNVALDGSAATCERDWLSLARNLEYWSDES